MECDKISEAGYIANCVIYKWNPL